MSSILHVLVVDNDDNNRESVRQVFEICGCEVTTACEAVEAAQCFMRERGIGLVVSDLNMGNFGRDGDDLFYSIRDELGHRGARFALMTGTERNPVICALEKCGVVIMKKPVGLQQFEKLITP